MTFNRWTPTFEWTWSYRIFQIHHTELNSFYWAHRAAFFHTFSATRGSSCSEKASKLFPNPLLQRRSGATLKEWAEDYGYFDEWARLGLLVGMTGYLECYIRDVAHAALQSCPALLVGGFREIDGVKLLKRRLDYDYSDKVLACAKGTWEQRLGAYRALFGTVPKIIEGQLKELEKLRRLRNSAGHAFGRDSDGIPLAAPSAKPLRRIKESQFLAYLKLADDVAREVEAHLGSEFIGCYETILFYHRWDKQFPKGSKTEAVAFVEHLAKHLNWAVGNQYAEALISHYKAA